MREPENKQPEPQKPLDRLKKLLVRLGPFRLPLGILIALMLIFLVGNQITSATNRPSNADSPQTSAAEARATPDLDLLPLFRGGGGVEPQVVQRRPDLHTIIPDRPRFEIVTYVVEEGDYLFGIADLFNINPETILWGNFDVLEDDPHSLRPGQELKILPVNGTAHSWNEGDTLISVADLFDVTPDDIINWPGNNLPQDVSFVDPDIEPGTFLVVPGGSREFVSWNAPRITRTNPAVARQAGPGFCGEIYTGPFGEGVFIWPTIGTWISGYAFSSYHPGIDIGGSTGNAVYSSASGVVVYSGWSNVGYGNMVVVDHGDGWQTLYAHLDSINAGCGASVYQGTVLGGLGSTGNSTGPHLHFEMMSDLYGKVNPFNWISP